LADWKKEPVNGKFYHKNYWRFGFKSRLYDLLTPEAYIDSARRAVRCVPQNPGSVWLDAGCGAGLLLQCLMEQAKPGLRYVGTDILLSGLKSARRKADARRSGEIQNPRFIQWNMTQPLPFRTGSFDVIVAHFSIYTIPDPERRRQAIRNLAAALKPEGWLVLVNPSREYDAKRIIQESLAEVRNRQGTLAALVRKLALYPLTLHLGLKFIEQQLKLGHWHAFSREESCAEMEKAGLVVKHTESVYAASGHLVAARRLSGKFKGPG